MRTSNYDNVMEVTSFKGQIVRLFDDNEGYSIDVTLDTLGNLQITHFKQTYNVDGQQIYPVAIAPESRPKTLLEEITAAVNRYNEEKHSNTPDYILGAFLVKVLASYHEAVTGRDEWHKVTKPGFQPVANLDPGFIPGKPNFPPGGYMDRGGQEGGREFCIPRPNPNTYSPEKMEAQQKQLLEMHQASMDALVDAGKAVRVDDIVVPVEAAPDHSIYRQALAQILLQCQYGVGAREIDPELAKAIVEAVDSAGVEVLHYSVGPKLGVKPACGVSPEDHNIYENAIAEILFNLEYGPFHVRDDFRGVIRAILAKYDIRVKSNSAHHIPTLAIGKEPEMPTEHAEALSLHYWPGFANGRYDTDKATFVKSWAEHRQGSTGREPVALSNKGEVSQHIVGDDGQVKQEAIDAASQVPGSDERGEWPCGQCEGGEMKQEGYTSPSGLTTYQCTVCSHRETFP